MTRPVRLQLSRRRGFDLQAHSRAVNGLPATVVARPGRWGNPYRVGVDGDRATCVARYAEFMATRPDDLDPTPLRGRNLACWCPLDGPCHADVLLALANPRSDDRS
ncbi:DUF4326 domain-containing protein [Luteimonas sp. FCS-9]|uniref:DUF4326 domain-containing protein n=1 Tax=Luteimonas sp. FCS-9 TaxID=1547516 RepID=UPI00063EAA7D|nr:DUF4326 domain-containing protein [Luteimonas sp. FCS-9]KLI97636.1 hypothetical protein WQ56_16735 [Luteimonas sp. FCS-9]